MIAYFNNGIVLVLTRAQALEASHVGECDADVYALSQVPAVARQLRKLAPDAVRAELRGYGAWDADQLADHDQNLQRLLWLAAGHIREELNDKRKGNQS